MSLLRKSKSDEKTLSNLVGESKYNDIQRGVDSRKKFRL